MPTFNPIQRAGVVAAFLGLIAVVFLHNPTGGYDSQIQKTQYTRLPPEPGCSMQRFADLSESKPNRPIEEIREHANLSRLCFPASSELIYVALPFSQWSSSGAILPWLGNVANALWSLAALLAAAVVWVRAFRDAAAKGGAQRAL